MKSIKITMVALIATIFLVTSFAFSAKKIFMVYYTYTPSSGRSTIEPGTNSSIDPYEMTESFLDYYYNWCQSGFFTGHSQGPKLYGIQFNLSEISPEDAINAVKLFYTSGVPSGMLPFDGQSITASKSYGWGTTQIWIYRKV